MADYSQFEAGTKSGIHADTTRIRKHDELIGKALKRRSSSICCFVVSLMLAVGVSIILKSFIPAVVFGLASAFFFVAALGDGCVGELYEGGL